MGIVRVTYDSFRSTLADQWRDIITAGEFKERTLVGPGIRRESTWGFGRNRGLESVLTNGSLIFVPENTVAFIFSQSGIEQVIDRPGGYEYQNGQASVFDGTRHEKGRLGRALGDEMRRRIAFAGNPADEKRVAFVNMREIRGIKFGTKGPLTYHDRFYEADLELQAHGVFAVRVTDPVRLLRDFVPANCDAYSLDFPEARGQLTADLLHSFIVATNQLSAEYRLSQLPSQADAILRCIDEEDAHAGTWDERFGLKLTDVALENIEFSADSRKLVQDYNSRRMSVAAFEGVTSHASDVSAQQKIAEGIREHGLGDAGGMMVGMGFASQLNPTNASPATQAVKQAAPQPAAPRATASIDEQMDQLERLKGLLDSGVLTQEEFAAKKREILGL